MAQCLWTWLHCASKKLRLFRNNFLKVHFKLTLRFFFLMREQVSSYTDSLRVEKPERSVLLFLKKQGQAAQLEF